MVRQITQCAMYATVRSFIGVKNQMQPICCNTNAKYKFRPQGIRDNYFELRETPQNGTFEGRGVGL